VSETYDAKAEAEAVATLIRAKSIGRLKKQLTERPAADLADLLEVLPPEEAGVVFRLLPRDVAGEVFADLDSDRRDRLFASLGSEEVAAVLDEMAPDDRTQLFEELPGEATQRLLNALSPDERRVARTLLGYPEDSIGRLMTPDYVMVRPSWTVGQALAHVRERYRDAETANVIYVVGPGFKLIDDIRLGEIVAARPEQHIEELMDHTFVALEAHADQETAVSMFKRYYRVALPVTDSSGVLVGIVTLDDVLQVAEEEATEDIQKMGGLEALDEPYATTRFWTLIRKRAGWLALLFVGSTFTADAMKSFEGEIQRALVLALFVPLIVSSGGNSGSQAATLVIRALAVGELTIRDWWRVMRRELISGIVLGGLLGSLGFLRILIGAFLFHEYGVHWPLLGLTVWISLLGVVLVGTVAGSMLPLLLQRLGFDPAVSSTPFIATIVDVIGIALYFHLAAFILGGTLL
jgi:magnesium transporter